jgi:hypothetical protein
VEPDYLPNFRGLCFQPVFIPHEDCTPLHAGGLQGACPPVGGFEGKSSEGKISL